jgi:hypothetical protein
VLLRGVLVERYFSASGLWTDVRDKALDFGGTPEAIRFAFAKGLDNVELVFAYEDADLDVSFELHPRQTVKRPVSWLETLCQPPAQDFA